MSKKSSDYVSQNVYDYQTTLIGGQTYALWYLQDRDFSKVSISSGCLIPPENDAIILRYNFTNVHEDIKTKVNNVAKTKSAAPLVKATCQYGDFYSTRRYFFVCISKRGWTETTTLEIESTLCTVNCPPPIDYDVEVDIFCSATDPTPILWSNPLIWRKERLPTTGENVTVPTGCNVILDADIELNLLGVDGTLTIKDENRVLAAKLIWVQGTLQAGTEATPFANNLNIKLLGAKGDETHVLNPVTGWGKAVIVTGKFLLYGKTPTTVSTKLTAIAAAGATTITVASTTGWVAGNILGISPSYSNFFEYEKVTVVSVTPTTVTFTPALKYGHYGSASAITNDVGTIDMRANVGLLDRNIKITRGTDPDNWGFSILIYGWKYFSANYNGLGIFNGV